MSRVLGGCAPQSPGGPRGSPVFLCGLSCRLLSPLLFLHKLAPSFRSASVRREMESQPNQLPSYKFPLALHGPVVLLVGCKHMLQLSRLAFIGP